MEEASLRPRTLSADARFSDESAPWRRTCYFTSSGPKIGASRIDSTEMSPTIGNRLVTALVPAIEILLLLCPQIFTDAFRSFHQRLQSD